MSHLDQYFTPGVLEQIIQAEPEDAILTSQPVVQFLSIKAIDAKPAAGGAPAQVERYRIIISDGQNYLQSMLATQLNPLVRDGAVGKQSIVRITQFTVNTVREKRLTIILGLEVILKDTEKYGDPKPLDGPPAPGGAGVASSSTVTTPVPQAAPVSAAAPAARQQDVKPRVDAGPKQPTRPTYPIGSLSPYQNNWVIKARVTQKSDIRKWANQKGEGQLFSVTLMDESGEIRATGFNTVVDELYPKFVEGKVYYISKAKIQFAKKKFSNLTNDYEITMERGTEVEECRDVANVPQIKYTFIELGNLGQIEKDGTCDIIAIVKDVGEVGSITTKAAQKQLTKRELTLVDRTAVQTRLTLWGKQAEDWTLHDQPVIACKGVKVGDFGGRSLSFSSTATMSVNPDIVEAHALRGWYDSMGHNASFTAQAGSGPGGPAMQIKREDFTTLFDVKASEMGRSDKVEYFTARATIVHIKPEPVSYPGCPKCNKKVTEEGDSWRCEKCETSYPAPKYRYMLAFAVSDFSGQLWFQSFNDSAEIIMGLPADELHERRQNDEASFGAAMHKANYGTYDFVCRAKQDTYNENTRVRYAISQIKELNYLEETKYLHELLNSSWAA